MLPKNSKHFVLPTAESLQEDSALVESVIDFYYKEVRKTLISFKSPYVMIENLGSFRVKNKEVYKLLKKYEAQLEYKKEAVSNRQGIIREALQTKVNNIKNLQKMIESERTRKSEFFKAKKNGQLRKKN